MRRAHLTVGILAVLAFVISGQAMARHLPPMSVSSAEARLLYRSRHIYLLGSALVNLMLGLYLQHGTPDWRRAVRTAGSMLVIASPVLLATAFVIEPARGFQAEMRWSSGGLFTLFAAAYCTP